MNRQLKILHLPKWYPNPDDPQLGIFVKKQIDAVSNTSENVVLSIVGSKNNKTISITLDNTNKATVIQIVYPSQGNAFRKLKRYLKAVETGLTKIADLGFYPDIIHGHINGRNMWVANKYFKEVPTLLSEHWSGYIDGRFKQLPKWKKKLYLKYFNQSKVVLVVSPHLKKALEEAGVTTPIEIVENVIEVSETSQAKEKQFTFLMVNDLVDATKNISGVLEAFHQITMTHPNIQLTIIGDGNDKEKLIAQTKELNLSGNVRFLGRKTQQEVLDFYTKAHCVIVNSNFETYSMVTAEAILSGIPVIATRCKGPEQFINSDNGILIDKANTDQLVEAMKKVYMQIQNYSSDKVKNSIKKELSSEKIGSQLLKHYEEIAHLK